MRRLGGAEWLALAKPILTGRLIRYTDSGAPGEVDRFEQRLAQTMGVRHTLAVSSGTTALISMLAAAGIGPGDEVIVPAYTWIATAIAPLAVGAVPVLANVDESLTLDPKDLPARLSPATRAILVVHMGNAVCDMEAILAFARAHNLMVFEDACQAVGVRYKGRPVGSLGDAGAFSFNAYKNLSSGEGGAVLTNASHLYARARIYHDCGDFGRGQDSYNEPAFVGLNFKANELQGAILNVQLAGLSRYVARMRRRRAVLAQFLSRRKDCRITPHHDPANACSLSVVFETEDAALAFAKHRGVARVRDNSKHVFTNWESIIHKRPVHPKMNPWAWGRRTVDYDPATYAQTLDILARTCRINVRPEWPLPVVHAFGAWLQSRPLTPAPAPRAVPCAQQAA